MFKYVLAFLMGIALAAVVTPYFFRSDLPSPTEEIAVAPAAASEEERTPPHKGLFPVVILRIEDGATIAVAQGTGFLVGEKERLIATALHVPAHADGVAGQTVHALIQGETCELRLLWKHKTADIALMRPVCKTHPLFQAPLFTLERSTPEVGVQATISGYQTPEKGVSTTSCEQIDDVFFCPRSIRVAVTIVDAPMSQISIITALNQLEQFVALLEKDPNLTYSDLFYDTHLVAELSSGVQTRMYFSGLSGGALLDAAGNVLGVIIADNGTRFIFVPAREFPAKYFTKR